MPSEFVSRMNELLAQNDRIRARPKHSQRVADFSKVHEKLANSNNNIDVLEEPDERFNRGISMAQEIQSALSRFTNMDGEWDFESVKCAIGEMINFLQTLQLNPTKAAVADAVKDMEATLMAWKDELKGVKGSV